MHVEDVELNGRNTNQGTLEEIKRGLEMPEDPPVIPGMVVKENSLGDFLLLLN